MQMDLKHKHHKSLSRAYWDLTLHFARNSGIKNN